MAKKQAQAKVYIVTVEGNPNYCGEGAGGAQFAHGKATIDNANLAAWFKAHKGYKVTEAKVDVTEPDPEPDPEAEKSAAE